MFVKKKIIAKIFGYFDLRLLDEIKVKSYTEY